MTTPQHRTTTGHLFSEGEWLDAHFEACRPEYEQALRSVGLQPGWRVLDAGCGSGSFLPWIARAVGQSGEIVALDLAPENVAFIECWIEEEWSLQAQVAAVEGSVFDLPFEDVALRQEPRQPDAENHPLDRPDFYWCEGQAVSLGRVPE